MDKNGKLGKKKTVFFILVLNKYIYIIELNFNQAGLFL